MKNLVPQTPSPRSMCDIYIDFCQYQTFLSIIEYIYTGSFDWNDILSLNPNENLIAILEDFLRASHALLLLDIHERTQFKLLQLLDESNLSSMFQLAEKYNARILSDSCKQYVLSNFDVLSDSTKRSLPTKQLRQLIKERSTLQILSYTNTLWFFIIFFFILNIEKKSDEKNKIHEKMKKIKMTLILFHNLSNRDISSKVSISNSLFFIYWISISSDNKYNEKNKSGTKKNR